MRGYSSLYGILGNDRSFKCGPSRHQFLDKRHAHFRQDTADCSRNEELEASGACDQGRRNCLMFIVVSLGFKGERDLRCQ